jgi:hypothetical protein
MTSAHTNSSSWFERRIVNRRNTRRGFKLIDGGVNVKHSATNGKLMRPGMPKRVGK